MSKNPKKRSLLVRQFITLIAFIATVPAFSTSSIRADGITWTSQTSAADNNWLSVTWGGPAGQEKFVAVAASGTGNRVMTSPDGITWTSQISAANNNWTSVTWGGPTGQQKFVAVAYTGTGNRVMTSPDGITWTSQASAANNDWLSVTWGGPTGQQKFVAVAYSGTGNRVMTSPDGITWTSRTSATETDWYSVTWGGPAGQQKFVAVAASGAGNRVMTSPDGITWATQTSAANNEWFSVTWGGPAGQEKFVAVAINGANNRVMTSGFTASTPSAPTITSIASGDSSLTVSFTAAADGGSPITNYKYSIDGTNYIALNPATTTSPFTISGLTNGTTYSVTIKAVNAIGESSASNIVAGTPASTVNPTTTVAPTTTTVAPTTTSVAPSTTTTSLVTLAPPTVSRTATVTKSDSLPETGQKSSKLVYISALLVMGGITLRRQRRIV